jgi:hypothetical protein
MFCLMHNLPVSVVFLGAKGDLAKGIRQSLPLWNMKRRFLRFRTRCVKR